MDHELNHDKIINFVEKRNRHQLRKKRLEVDLERYQAYIDDNDLSDQQKAEFLNALWTVIVAFVDFGYGVHPVQSSGAEIISFPSPRPYHHSETVETGEAQNV